MKWLRRYDGLFMRLLMVQSAFTIGLTLIYFTVYVFERNHAASSALADSWSEKIAQVAQVPAKKDHQASLLAVRRDAPPEPTYPVPQWLPRFKAIKETLDKKGISISDMVLQIDTDPSTIWLKVRKGADEHVWVGVNGPFWNAKEAMNILAMTALTIVLLTGVSWMPARYITHRLIRLRKRMDSDKLRPPTPPSGREMPEFMEIDQAYDRLMTKVRNQQSERALLLAGISHDLRSPLCRIRLAAELLPDTEENSTGRSRIIDNVRVADRLIEAFMDLVRSTELPMNENVNVSECARKAVHEVSTGEVAPKVAIEDGVHLYPANTHLIERAISNLLDNALRHGAAPVSLQVGQVPGAVVIAVHDCGPGMTPEASKTMLKPFSRGDESRSKPGSGLGLAIVKEVVDRMNGRIEFAGQPGNWTVKLTLPGRAPAS